MHHKLRFRPLNSATSMHMLESRGRRKSRDVGECLFIHDAHVLRDE
jgi:hypothetical protein